MRPENLKLLERKHTILQNNGVNKDFLGQTSKNTGNERKIQLISSHLRVLHSKCNNQQNE